MAEGRGGGANVELTAFLRGYRNAFLGIGVMSAAVNVLTLTGTLYMLEVYDRVLPSRSVPTLIGISLIVLGLFALQGGLEFLRGRILTWLGAALDESFGARVYRVILRLPLVARTGGDGQQPLRDLDNVRGFIAGPGPTALFDLPWMPLYLALAFVFHFWIGMTALIGAAILVGLTVAAERLTKQPAREAMERYAARNAITEATRRNAEVVRAMGMAQRLTARWLAAHDGMMRANLRASTVAGSLGALSRTLRTLLQSLVLGVGAYLAIHQEVSAGAIIACSILLSKALQPVEQSIAHWKPLLSARQSWERLATLLDGLPETAPPLALPAPAASLSVEGVFVTPPGGRRPVVQGLSFALQRGQGLGIVGPSASGKSTLARALVGVWPAVQGSIRLDGATLEQWSPEGLGHHVGYLPQDIELFDGTIAENIARFDPNASPEAVIAAARRAGVHDMIVRFEKGYETPVQEGGAALSGGQRQRIALARALYADPFLVVLDEPNSNLDADGEDALTQAVASVRERGGIVVVVAHRPSALASVDQVLVMAEGRQQAFGPKTEIFDRFVRRLSPVPSVPTGRATPGSIQA